MVIFITTSLPVVDLTDRTGPSNVHLSNQANRALLRESEFSDFLGPVLSL